MTVATSWSAETEAALQRTHEDLGPASEAFRQYLLADPARQTYFDYRDARRPQIVLHFSYPIQSWPLLLSAPKVAAFERISVGLVRLARSIPERFLDNDAERLQAYFRVPEALAAAVKEPTWLDLDTGCGRCDIVDDGDRLHLLELNMGSNLGGWQLRYWQPWVMGNAPFLRFAGQAGIKPKYRDVLYQTLCHAIESMIARGLDSRGLNLAFVTKSEKGVPELTRLIQPLYQRALQQVAPDKNGTIVPTTYPGLFRLEGDRGLVLGGVPIQAVFEFTDHPTPPEVFRAYKEGSIVLLNVPLHALVGNKRCLALLSEHQDSDRLTAEERSLVSEVIPWTREFVPGGRVTYEGREHDLEELLRSAREHFVLKGETGIGGNEVVVGPHADAATWEAAIARARDAGDWLVQRYVASRPYLLQDHDGTPRPHDIVWGLYVTGRRYAGAFVRAQVQGRGDGIINAARGASEALVFEV
ncbi:MAG: hypothetical protein SF066_21335 [Thermoanaerobaculia bacterium]|nr:hypothetical protein [Thermoanaerobaculia bacterium]